MIIGKIILCVALAIIIAAYFFGIAVDEENIKKNEHEECCKTRGINGDKS